MKNKRLAICLVIFIFLVLTIVLTSTIFALDNVSVNMLDNSDKFSENYSEIINNAEFNYGSNVLFLNKKKYVNKIEMQNPYIKVVNIETIFPNKLIINAVERIETFAVKQKDNTYAIIDEDGKVLKVAQTFISTSENAILLEGIKEFDVLSVGEFISFDSRQGNLFCETFNSFREWKLDYDILKSKIESLTIDYERENQLKIEMFSGVEIIVKDANEYNSDKLNHVFSAYDSNVNYQQTGRLEVRLCKIIETDIYELRVFYNQIIV